MSEADKRPVRVRAVRLQRKLKFRLVRRRHFTLERKIQHRLRTRLVRSPLKRMPLRRIKKIHKKSSITILK